ncbi:MAG: sce7726 family protein [Firmicutes bacterium]|nr:sce7726 family protein [Bacillota bacterium]
MLNESCIREALAEWLMSNPNHKIRVFDELQIGECIADIISVTDCITGYEIKSDRDTYTRLNGQIKMYDKFCNFCYLVIGAKHIKSAGSKIPEHWGLILISKKENKLSIELLRKAQENKFAKLSNQLSLLWGNELSNITKRFQLSKQSMSKTQMKQKLLKSLIPNKLLLHICDQLFERDYTAHRIMTKKTY